MYLCLCTPSAWIILLFLGCVDSVIARLVVVLTDDLEVQIQKELAELKVMLRDDN